MDAKHTKPSINKGAVPKYKVDEANILYTRNASIQRDYILLLLSNPFSHRYACRARYAVWPFTFAI